MTVFWILLVFIVGLFVFPIVFLGLIKYYGWLSDNLFDRKRDSQRNKRLNSRTCSDENCRVCHPDRGK